MLGVYVKDVGALLFIDAADFKVNVRVAIELKLRSPIKTSLQTEVSSSIGHREPLFSFAFINVLGLQR